MKAFILQYLGILPSSRVDASYALQHQSKSAPLVTKTTRFTSSFLACRLFYYHSDSSCSRPVMF